MGEIDEETGSGVGRGGRGNRFDALFSCFANAQNMGDLALEFRVLETAPKYLVIRECTENV